MSKRQRQVQARRRELHRKLAATRKRSHGQLAHRVLALGSAFQLEQLSYRAWQKIYGKSVQLCAPGMFVERLSRLAASAGGTVVADQRLARTSLPNLSLWASARRKPAPSAGRSAPVARAPSGISSRPIWPALSIPRRPCSTRVRHMRPGRGGSPPCKRHMSRPFRTNPQEAGVCLPPLVGPRLARVRVGRLHKGRQSDLRALML